MVVHYMTVNCNRLAPLLRSVVQLVSTADSASRGLSAVAELLVEVSVWCLGPNGILIGSAVFARHTVVTNTQTTKREDTRSNRPHPGAACWR